MAYAGYVCAAPCPGSRFLRGSSSDELQTPLTGRAAILGRQRKLTFTFPPHRLKTAGAALRQAAQASSCPQSRSSSARGRSQERRGGRRVVTVPWVTAASHSWVFSSRAWPSSLSPAAACVLPSSSPNRGEQRESQLPREHAARTDRSRGPTPRCPTAESEGEEECESVQNWINAELLSSSQPPFARF